MRDEGSQDAEHLNVRLDRRPGKVSFGRMRILTVLLAVILLGLLGTAGFAAVRDECSYSPGGQFNIMLTSEGIAHFFDENRECDPWKVVEPDDTVRSVTILPYSSWTDAPARAVTIQRDGKLLISDPIKRNEDDSQWPEWDYKPRIKLVDPELAQQLLASLSRIARFNRFTTEDVHAVTDRLEAEGADITDSNNYLLEPKVPCRGTMYDGGGVTLEVVMLSGHRREVSLNSFCHSIAKQSAIEATWTAREKVYKAAHFSGEHFVDELATF